MRENLDLAGRAKDCIFKEILVSKVKYGMVFVYLMLCTNPRWRRRWQPRSFALSLFLYIVCFFVFRATVLWSRATILWSHSVERIFSTAERPLLGFFHHLSLIRGSLSSWEAELRHYTGYCAESAGEESVLARW
ncbi:hypothetical protein ILYODFUR_010877 [Ilyodon furcidens]|uniref:Uncharacterized protein n=1 Tax=Ilyodon furcidens TaxID=33524 RepID=A0ABV0V221_9TELE